MHVPLNSLLVYGRRALHLTWLGICGTAWNGTYPRSSAHLSLGLVTFGTSELHKRGSSHPDRDPKPSTERPYLLRL